MKNVIFLFSFLILSCSCSYARSSLQPKTGIAEVNGTKLYYELAGAGECIVFIHGNIGDCRHWDNQIDFFAKKYQVLRYDVRGYGQSAMPVKGEKYSDHGDLRALLDYLDIEKVHIVGFSMGSSIAVNFALEYPKMTSSLVPVGPWVNGYDSPAASDFLREFRSISSIVNEKGVKVAAEEHVEFEYVNSHIMSRKVKKRIIDIAYDYTFWHFINRESIRIEPDAVNLIENIEMPALIFTSEYDIQVCREVADLLKEKILHSTKVDIKDATHFMFMDKPKEFNNALSEFIVNLKY
ncbi:alpha/beta fold hydrolase [Maribellus mangrovi]|uniref:alpha/beta fold hydrolase n=1 Tax=Maribellus mangrovi TaxID=3133146 RepID=UPI0030EE68AE